MSQAETVPVGEYSPVMVLHPQVETFTIKEFAYFLGGPKPDGKKPQISYHTARRIIRKHGGYIIVGNGNPGYQPIRIPVPVAEEIKRSRTTAVQRTKNGGRQ